MRTTNTWSSKIVAVGFKTVNGKRKVAVEVNETSYGSRFREKVSKP